MRAANSKCFTASVAVVLLSAGCSTRPEPAPSLTLATTTSTRDSRLLDVLIPPFENQTGIEVKVVAVGSGQALELGRRGDADVLLTHSPQAEEQFVADGHGAVRRSVMYNDFLLVGPPADPANVKGLRSIVEAFRRAAAGKVPWISRSDESGTHVKERKLWAQAGIEPEGTWYIRSGTGMAQALRMASEKRAYVLADRGTFLAQRQQLELVPLVEGDDLLRNPYSVIVVRSEKHPGVNERGARRLADYLVGPEAQQIIGAFGVGEFGQPLFFPDAAGPSARRKGGWSFSGGRKGTKRGDEKGSGVFVR